MAVTISSELSSPSSEISGIGCFTLEIAPSSESSSMRTLAVVDPEGFLLAISPSDLVSDLVSQAESCCALKDTAAKITAANVRIQYLVMLYRILAASGDISTCAR